MGLYRELTTKALKRMSGEVAAELERRGEDDPQWLKGYNAGEASADTGCPCDNPNC